MHNALSYLDKRLACKDRKLSAIRGFVELTYIEEFLYLETILKLATYEMYLFSFTHESSVAVFFAL